MTGGPQYASYGPADLSIGAVVNVYGRKVVLTDCDPFTKEFYRVTYGFGMTYYLFLLNNFSKTCFQFYN